MRRTSAIRTLKALPLVAPSHSIHAFGFATRRRLLRASPTSVSYERLSLKASEPHRVAMDAFRLPTYDQHPRPQQVEREPVVI